MQKKMQSMEGQFDTHTEQGLYLTDLFAWISSY